MQNRSLSALLLLCCTAAAYGADTFNPASGQLTVPALVIGSATYFNVVLKPGAVLGIAGGAPNGSMDTYNPALKQLTVPAVAVGAATYTNVLVAVTSLVSVGAANWVDSYNSSNGQLRISAVQVGSATYNNVVITVGSIVGVTGGMPTVTGDQYNAANRQLTIPAVQVGNHIYTNALITVGGIVSVGAASRFNDAPVQGLCYTTCPSSTAIASATNVNGQYLYDAGDVLAYWVDGTGGGCTGTSPSDSTSVFLGELKPTGSQTSVLALPPGLEAAATLTALNIGSAASMNVSGLVINGTDVANLNNFIGDEGQYAFPPSASGSVDTFFNGVQADTVLLSGSGAPAFVMPVAANASTTTTIWGNKVAADLLTVASTLPGQPTSFVIPASGQLNFSEAVSTYTCPICAAPSTVYTGASAALSYFDGHGNITQFNSPGSAKPTVVLADKTTSGTYSINKNIITTAQNGTQGSTGYTFSVSEPITVNYSDGETLIGSGPISETYTSGPYSGMVYATGSSVFSSVRLAPMTLSMLAGHSVTIDNFCGQGTSGTLTFTGVGPGPSSVTLTQSSQTCAISGQLPITITASTIPGLVEATDTSGFIAYVGLYGAALAAGAEFMILQEAAGSACSNCNGGIRRWRTLGPFASVN